MQCTGGYIWLLRAAGLLSQSPLVAMRESQVKALASLKDKRILEGALDGLCHPLMAHEGLNSELTSAYTSPLGWGTNVHHRLADPRPKTVFFSEYLLQSFSQFAREEDLGNAANVFSQLHIRKGKTMQ